MSSSDFASSRKRLSEQDHYDPLERTTRRTWTVPTVVDPCVLLDFAASCRMVKSQRATIQDGRHRHSPGFRSDRDTHKTNMQSTTSRASSRRITRNSSPVSDYATHHLRSRTGASEAREVPSHQGTNTGDNPNPPHPTVEDTVFAARSPSRLSSDFNSFSPCYVPTSPQFCPNPYPHDPSPFSPAFTPRPFIPFSPGSPDISSTSPDHISSTSKVSPASPKISTASPGYGRSPGRSDYHPWPPTTDDINSFKFTPELPNLNEGSPGLSSSPGWSEYRPWQAPHSEDSLNSAQYATEGSTLLADRSRTLDLARANSPWSQTFRVSDPEIGHTLLARGTDLPDDLSFLGYDRTSSYGADSPDYRSYFPYHHLETDTQAIDPPGSRQESPSSYSADSPGYHPYFPYHYVEAGTQAIDPHSSRQQNLDEAEDMGTRSAREENVPPETPGSSPNNPIVLSPILGFSRPANLSIRNGLANRAMRSERLSQNTRGSSSPSLRSTSTQTSEVSELSSNSDPSLQNDGNEDQSPIMHEDQPRTHEVAATTTLKAEVDKAISLLNKVGVPGLGRAVRDLYALSKDDQGVAEVMTRVLLGTPTVEQVTSFQHMIDLVPTYFLNADDRRASPSLAEDSESHHDEIRGSLAGEEAPVDSIGEGESVYSFGEGESVCSIEEGTSVYQGDLEEDYNTDDASTASFPSVPSSPSTVKGDEVQDHLSAETVWGTIAGQYIQEEQED